MNYSAEIGLLFGKQLIEWSLAGNNYAGLEKVVTRSIPFNKFSVSVQFNPGRIISTAAKVDSASIASRPCFLCGSNRPAVQKGIKYGGDLEILINPFPIFRRHLTIVSLNHTDQRIDGKFGSMLDLARDLDDFVIFYNGPECGASAPDHFHFQAGNKAFLPIEEDFRRKCCVNLLTEWEEASVWKWNGYGRGIVSVTGSDRNVLCEIFSGFLSQMGKLQPEKPEPMMNILASFEKGEWIVHLMPRIKHRPLQYFYEDGSKIVLSPASVDLGGVIITPREEDYLKLTGGDILDIFNQVCFDEQSIESLFTDFQ